VASNDVIVQLRLIGSRAFRSEAHAAAGSIDEIGDEAAGAEQRAKHMTNVLGSSFLSLRKTVDRTAGSMFNLTRSADKMGGAAEDAGFLAESAGRGIAFMGSRAFVGVAALGALGVAALVATPYLASLFATVTAGAAAGGVAFALIAAAVDRFNQTSKKAGTPAHALAQQLKGLKTLLRSITAPGADILLGSLTKALKLITPALKPLKGPLRAFAQVMGRELVQSAKGLVGLMPRVVDLIEALAPSMRPLSRIATSLGRAFLNIAEAGVGNLPKLVGVIADVAKWFENLTAGKGKTVGFFSDVKRLTGDLIEALKPIGPFFQNVVAPLLKGFGKGLLDAITVGIKIIGVLAKVLGWVGERAKPLRGFIEAVGQALTFVFGPAILGKAKLLGPVFRLIGRAINWVAGRVGALGRWFAGLGPKAKAVVSAVGRFFAGLGTTIKDKVTGAVNWVKTAFNNVVSWVKRLPGRIANAAKGLFNGIKTAFKNALNWVIGKWNSLEFRIPGFDLPGPGPKFKGFTLGVPDIPLLQAGGVVRRGGAAVVGETGPELVRLPGGASVAPLTAPSLSTLSDVQRPIVVHSQLVVDRRVLAQAVSDDTADRIARR
jgi:phage-related protein